MGRGRRRRNLSESGTGRCHSGSGMGRVLTAVAVVISAFVLSACGANSSGSYPSRSALPPSPRWGANLVYDQAHRELMLFGGATRTGALNETWGWDGKSWRLYHPHGSPPLGIQAVAAYDEAHHDVVLFGAVQDRTNARAAASWANSTWSWDGDSWSKLRPQHQPALTLSWSPTMAFDPVSKTVLLFGFERVASGNTSTMRAETWSWNGSDWKLLSPAASPQSTGQLVGGGTHLYLTGVSQGIVGGSFASGMWEWDGSNWLFTKGGNSPSGATAFDAPRSMIVVFNRDTWTWDGSNWLRQHPQRHPAATGYAVYFPPLREIVMWGDVLGVASNDMWAWDGNDWRLLQPGNLVVSPTPGHVDSATPADAAASIRRTVTSTSPVLLPAWLPDGLDAMVDATPDYFSVVYQTDQRDKEITFGIIVPNPPPGGANSRTTWIRFRNAIAQKYGPNGYAEYFVYDVTDANSARYLIWIEPGTMSSSAAAEGFGGPGVPYFLSATGYSDQEFWQVANSLR